MPNPSLGELFTQTWQKIDQMKLHVCLSGEYNVTTLVPTVDYPEENTFYLVPDGTGNNVYTEWVYVNDNWERFGQASIDLSGYVQFTDVASRDNFGVVKLGTNSGIKIESNGTLSIQHPSDANIKSGISVSQPLTPSDQHAATFYGLAKAAGDTTQKVSDNAVGTYTADAKAAIQSMLGIIPATTSDYGLIKVGNGLAVDSNGYTYVKIADSGNVKSGTTNVYLIPCSRQHEAAFYGLAKAAGDTTQKASDNAVGVYTDDAKAAIQSMLGIGIASSSNLGLVKIATSGTGLYCHPTSGELSIAKASTAAIKNGTNQYSPIVPSNQHESIFYGLATAAGDATQKISDNAVGTYTNDAKAAIRNMLGVEDNFTRNSVNRVVVLGTIAIDGTEKTTTFNIRLLQEGTAQLVIESNATTIHLTKSTANDKIYYTSTETLQDEVTPLLALYHDSSATGDTTITYSVASDTTYTEQKTVAIYYPTYIVSTHGTGAFITSAKTGYAVKLVSTDDIATDSIPGVVKVYNGYGITIYSDGTLGTTTPSNDQIKALSNGYLVPKLSQLPAATFYGLAKVSGDTTQSISNNAVGLYTDDAKVAIQKMLGIYDAPWELIIEDTFTNAELAEHVIDTDSNGDAFSLTDVVVQITVKKDVAMEIDNYGKIEFYYDATHSKNLLIGVTSGTKTNDWYASAMILRNSNSMMAFTSQYGESGNARAVQVRNDDTLLNSIQNFKKIRLTSIKGSFTIKVYGKREWRT